LGFSGAHVTSEGSASEGESQDDGENGNTSFHGFSPSTHNTALIAALAKRSLCNPVPKRSSASYAARRFLVRDFPPQNNSLIPTCSDDELARIKVARGIAMYTKVMRNQFEIKEGAIIHTPTGAEFTPVTGTADSILIWTGEMGRLLQTGELYRYADVFAVMKTIWQQGLQAA
jgi:hypothetical protein